MSHHRRPLVAGATLVAALILAACAENPTQPAAAPAPRLAAAAANGTISESDLPIHQPVFVPCGRLGREIVPTTGTEHVTSQWQANASGGGHLRMHVNATAEGTGLVSGDLYRVNGATQESYEFDTGGFPFSYDLTYSFHVTSAGANGNIVAREVLRVNYDAVGVPTLQVVKFDAECR